MRRFYLFFVSVLSLFFFTACNSASEIGDSTSENTQEPARNSEKEETTNQTTSVEKAPNYQEKNMPAGYLIYGQQVFLGEDTEGLLTLDFIRTEKNNSKEENLKQSLRESDATSQKVLTELENVTIENKNEANLTFTPEEKLSSMSSTEHTKFDEMLFQISSLYGIEKIHFYVGDGAGISYGQSGTVTTMDVKANENRGYYLFPIEETDDPDYSYITGATAGEDIRDNTGELLDFAETIEAMRSVKADNVVRKPSIDDRVKVHSAKVDENRAEVKYTIEDDQEKDWTKEDQEQLEKVLQLTALDFDVDELQLVNEEEHTITIFPL